jgi:hypothetical protein
VDEDGDEPMEGQRKRGALRGWAPAGSVGTYQTAAGAASNGGGAGPSHVSQSSILRGAPPPSGHVRRGDSLLDVARRADSAGGGQLVVGARRGNSNDDDDDSDDDDEGHAGANMRSKRRLGEGEMYVDEDDEPDAYEEETGEQERKFGLRNLLERLDIMMASRDILFFDVLNEACGVMARMVSCMESKQDDLIVLPDETDRVTSQTYTMKLLQTISMYSNESFKNIFQDDKMPTVFSVSNSKDKTLPGILNRLTIFSNMRHYELNEDTDDRMAMYLKPAMCAAYREALAAVRSLCTSGNVEVVNKRLFPSFTSQRPSKKELCYKLADILYRYGTFDGNAILSAQPEKHRAFALDCQKLRASPVFEARRRLYTTDKIPHRCTREYAESTLPPSDAIAPVPVAVTAVTPAPAHDSEAEHAKQLFLTIYQSIWHKAKKAVVDTVAFTLADVLVLGGFNARTYYDLYMFIPPSRWHPTQSLDRNHQRIYQQIKLENPELDDEDPPSLDTFWAQAQQHMLNLNVDTEYIRWYGVENFDEKHVFQRYAYPTTVDQKAYELFLMPLHSRAYTNPGAKSLAFRGPPAVYFGAKPKPKAKPPPKKKRDSVFDESDETAGGGKKHGDDEEGEELLAIKKYVELSRIRGGEVWARATAEIFNKEMEEREKLFTRSDAKRDEFLTLFARLVANIYKTAQVEFAKVRVDREPYKMRALSVERLDLQIKLADNLGVTRPYNVSESCFV